MSRWQLSRWHRGLLASATIGLFGAAFAVTPLGLDFERNFGLSWLFNIRGPIEPPRDVAVVAIDSSTGKKLDLPKMPRDWPRSVHARLLDSLVERGAGVVVFDFNFAKSKSNNEDQTFAQAIAAADRVVLYQVLTGRKRALYDSAGRQSGSLWVEEATPPARPLALAAKGLGPFPLPKTGQAAYEFWTFKASAGAAPTTASIALQLHALDHYDLWLDILDRAKAQGLTDVPSTADQIGGAPEVRSLMSKFYDAFNRDAELHGRVKSVIEEFEGLKPEERWLVSALADLYGGPENRYINFYGPPGTITTVPYHILVAENSSESKSVPIDLANKVVFVGYSDLYDPDQPDRFYTVFTGEDGIDLSGVEIMASAFANLLTARTVRPSGPTLNLLIIFVFGLAVGAIVYLLPAISGVPLAIAMAALYGASAQYTFNEAGLWLPVANPVLVELPIALLVGLMSQYLLERRKERQISRAISYYLPENIVRDLTEKRVDPDSVNKVVHGTCLATDMSGFTTISETKPPDELAIFMNAYFEALAQPLKTHAADVTEFHADTIMCAWTDGASTVMARQNAVLAAIDTVKAIRLFREQYDLPTLKPRIGLQCGNFYLGHTGGGGQFTYSILGDPANTAARLEALNKHLGTRILATEAVVEGLNDLLLRPLGSFRLVGKAEATPIVEILGMRNEATAHMIDFLTRFSDALEAFSVREWAKAENLFSAIVERYPADECSSLYLTTCRTYLRAGAPEDEPTVIRMVTK